jgi:Beta-galactosidase
LELRLKPSAQPLTDAWRRMPVAPRGVTLLGISFRPLQAATFGLETGAILQALLAYPFQLIRLGAYWNGIERQPGVFDTGELDRQIDAAEAAGKQIILCVGAIKTFGYPEFFVPSQYLPRPLPEHTRIRPSAYPDLLEAATEMIARLVERYKARQGIVAWQLEHEAVDPLGLEHSWRLDEAFVRQEADTLRKADPTRPLMLNGFLPASLPVRLSQWWRTRDQGDSLAVARRLADMVGIDYYPRSALLAFGDRTLYLDGSRSAWLERRRKQWLTWAGATGKPLLVSEGQAEPWEAVTTPPNPDGRGMYTCLPEDVIGNYNAWMQASGQQGSLYAYLFWGAEYWMLRKQGGDPSYLAAFARLLETA